MTTQTTQPNNKIAGIITATASLVSAIGISLSICISAHSGMVLKQVERQGNSVSLEQKRITAAALRSLATLTRKPEDEAMAKNAEEIYQKAKEEQEKQNK